MSNSLNFWQPRHRPSLASLLTSISTLSVWLLSTSLIGQSPQDPAYATSADHIDNALLSKLEESVLIEHGFADEFDAEVWFKSMYPRMSKFRIPEAEKLQILQGVHRESHLSNLDPALVLAVIDVESDFNRYAISRSGAQGLMQVMSFWKNELGRAEDNLTETQTNLRYGTTILSYYLERAKGDTTEALSRYNGSFPETWYAERVYLALQEWR